MIKTLTLLLFMISMVLHAQNVKKYIWDEDTPEQIESGIIMYEQGRNNFGEEFYNPDSITVIEVKFSSPFPESQFPEEILKFKNLKELYIENTKFKNLPEEIITLEKLEVIQLYNNKHMTSLPKCILCMPNLTTLNVLDSPLKTFPNIDPTKKHDSIKHISLGLTDIAEIPNEIYLLTNLEHLGVYGFNGYEDEEYPEYSMSIKFTPIKELPETIGKLSKLNTLDLRWTQINLLPETLEFCTNLMSIDIGGNPYLSEIPNFIKRDDLSNHYYESFEFNFSPDGLKKSDLKWMKDKRIDVLNTPGMFGSENEALYYIYK